MIVQSTTNPCQGSAWYKVEIWWAIWDNTAGVDVAGNVFTTELYKTSGSDAYCATMTIYNSVAGVASTPGLFRQDVASGAVLSNGGQSVTLTNAHSYIPRQGFQYTTYVDCDYASGSYNCAGSESEGSMSISSPTVTIT